MAVGEYVSVSSQSDTGRADLEKERQARDEAPKAELEELAQIYMARGVESGLARQLAAQLTEHDDLAAHARDELGISETVGSRPVQAALTSAATFSIGAALPLTAVVFAPLPRAIPVVSIASLISLALLGAVSAAAGGAGIVKAAAHVTIWGALAMTLTTGIGAFFGAVVWLARRPGAMIPGAKMMSDACTQAPAAPVRAWQVEEQACKCTSRATPGALRKSGGSPVETRRLDS